MKRALVLLLTTIGASLGLAAGTEFDRLSALAAKKYTRPTPGGSEYATKFADWSTKPMVHAMDVCAARPSSNLYCDIISVIAADGRVRRVLFAPNNAYTACLQKNLRLGALAPQPPAGDNWPVHIRLYDGTRPKYKGDAFIMLSRGHVP